MIVNWMRTAMIVSVNERFACQSTHLVQFREVMIIVQAVIRNVIGTINVKVIIAGNHLSNETYVDYIRL